MTPWSIAILCGMPVALAVGIYYDIRKDLKRYNTASKSREQQMGSYIARKYGKQL